MRFRDQWSLSGNAQTPGVRFLPAQVLSTLRLTALRTSRRRSYRPSAAHQKRSQSGPLLESFQGRSRELEELLRRHDGQRAKRDRLRAASPIGRKKRSDRAPAFEEQAYCAVRLLIHGMPGVGKSELAERLADHLEPRYPDGRLYANLGAAGEARSSRNVLEDFIRRLDYPWIDDSISTAELARLFQSLTATRRILFILDAVRSSYQILDVLPAEPDCAVIMTSRQDMSVPLGASSLLLEPPAVNEALDILRTVSGTDDSVRPECAVKVVEQCGRLPIAIRSVGERVMLDRADLCQVADLLEPKETRLDCLSYGGRAVRDRIESDLERIPHSHQHALAMLTVVRSSTFAPWVLGPLLEVPTAEAENL